MCKCYNRCMKCDKGFRIYVKELEKHWNEVYAHSFYDVYSIGDLWHEYNDDLTDIDDEPVPEEVYTLGNKWE